MFDFISLEEAENDESSNRSMILYLDSLKQIRSDRITDYLRKYLEFEYKDKKCSGFTPA